MKTSTYLGALLLVLLCTGLNAQWVEKSSFNQVVEDLLVFDNQLHIVGGFTERAGSTCYWSCVYNGSSFTNHTTLIGGTGLDQLAIFNGELYSTGGLSFGASLGVAKRSGSSWTNAGNFNTSHSGIFVDGNDLYVGSDFGVVSKKTGTGSFTSLPAMDDDNDNVYAITKYDENIVIAGELDTYNSVELNNIAWWDGSAWQPLGGGVSGEIRCVAVYNSELYVGGTFNTAAGSAAKYIAKWDGTNWSDVGGSMTGSGFNGVRDMAIYEGRLYVVGDFDEMGGVASKYVAVWDGQNWSSLSLDISSSFANSVTFFQDEIYVGTFDFSNANLYSNDMITDVDEPQQAIELSLYPNPVAKTFELTLAETDSKLALELVDMSGKILQTELIIDRTTSVNCEGLESGLYILLVKDSTTGELLGSRRFVKS